jgi:hypothetical protein
MVRRSKRRRGEGAFSLRGAEFVTAVDQGQPRAYLRETLRSSGREVTGFMTGRWASSFESAWPEGLSGGIRRWLQTSRYRFLRIGSGLAAITKLRSFASRRKLGSPHKAVLLMRGGRGEQAGP